MLYKRLDNGKLQWPNIFFRNVKILWINKKLCSRQNIRNLNQTHHIPFITLVGYNFDEVTILIIIISLVFNGMGKYFIIKNTL